MYNVDFFQFVLGFHRSQTVYSNEMITAVFKVSRLKNMYKKIT